MPSTTKPSSRPRGRPFQSPEERDRMKRRIAETAQHMFQEEGYASVSMRRLAAAVGCSPMTLYKYYDGKIAVLQTLWEIVFRDLFTVIRDELTKLSDPRERLRVFCQQYVGYWIAHPEHYRMVFMAEGVTQPEVSMFIDNAEVADGFQLMAQIYEAAVDRDKRGSSLKLDVDLLIGALHGIAHNQITISGVPWSEPEQMVDLLIEKLA